MDVNGQCETDAADEKDNGNILYSTVLAEGFFELNDDYGRQNREVVEEGQGQVNHQNNNMHVQQEEKEDRMIRRLDRLIAESYEKEVTFIAHHIEFTPKIAAATIRVFQYYSGGNVTKITSTTPNNNTLQNPRQHQWDELIFEQCLQNESFLIVLKEAFRCRLFRKIILHGPTRAVPSTSIVCHSNAANNSILNSDINDNSSSSADDDSEATDDQSIVLIQKALREETAIVLRDAMLESQSLAPNHISRSSVRSDDNSDNDKRTRNQEGTRTLIFNAVIFDETCLSELGRGLAASSNLSQLEFQNVKFSASSLLASERQHQGSESLNTLDGFLTGLSRNLSLRTLSITNPLRRTLPDARLAQLVSALPVGLKKLRLDTTTWHDHTLRALGTCLKSPECCWTELSLGNRLQDDNDDDFDFDDDDDFMGCHHLVGRPSLSYLLHGMTLNRTLEVLYLECCQLENDDFQLILTSILSGSCPRLVEIDLSSNQIWSLNMSRALEIFANHPSQHGATSSGSTTPSRCCCSDSRLRIIELSDNPIMDYWHGQLEWGDDIVHNHLEQERLIRLLETIPGLGHLDDDLHQTSLYTPYAEHLLDWNDSGRRLLLCGEQQGDTVPLSLWTLVLARAVEKLRDSDSRQANVIYHLLQGPAFASRGIF